MKRYLTENISLQEVTGVLPPPVGRDKNHNEEERQHAYPDEYCVIRHNEIDHEVNVPSGYLFNTGALGDTNQRETFAPLYVSLRRMLLQSSGTLVFARSLLRNPLAVGAVVPSSPRLSNLIASRVSCSNSSVLELGAGTGSITGALLKQGVDPERLFLIERDPSLVAFLRDRFPGVRIRCGDAAHASRILSSESVGQVKTVVSSLPVRNLTTPEQIAIIRAILKALAPGGQLIQFTYGSTCPIPAGTLGLTAERIGRVWLNLPPAAVWRFTRKQSHCHSPH